MAIDVHDWDYCTLTFSGHDISSRACTVVVMVEGDATCLIIVAAISFTPFLSLFYVIKHIRFHKFTQLFTQSFTIVHYRSL